MSLLKHWVIACDNDACAGAQEGIPAEFTGHPVSPPGLGLRGRTIAEAVQKGWASIEIGNVKWWFCPACRYRFREDTGTRTRFWREVIGNTEDVPGVITFKLSCDHEFTKLDPEPVQRPGDGSVLFWWECTACVRAWFVRGAVLDEELPRPLFEELQRRARGFQRLERREYERRKRRA